MGARLAFWRHNKESEKIEKLVELTTSFKGLPILDRGKFDTDSNIRQAIISSVPSDYKGIVLGNFEEKRTYTLGQGPTNEENISYWVNFWKIFEEVRPNCTLVNYNMPSVPFWSKGGYEEKIDYIINGDSELPLHWMLWKSIHGASISAYDPYSERGTAKFTTDQTHRRNKAYIELLDKLFPNRPKIINVWHRHSSGTEKFKQCTFEEMWTEQIEPFVNLDGYTIAVWGGFMDSYFRQSPEQELFKKNTADEHEKAGVNINDAEQCKKYYEKQFVKLCSKIDKRIKSGRR